MNVSLPLVNRLWSLVTLVLLAIWLPASSHELLESNGLIHAAHDAGPAHHDDTEHNPDHDLADGVCRFGVADTQVQLDQPVADVLLTAVATEGFATTQFEGVGERPAADPPGTAPPDLPTTWQFSFRAARLGRAPSFPV